MRRTLSILVAVFAVSAIMAGSALAACEWKHRIPHGDSECLTAKWKNHNAVLGHPKNWVTAQSSCSDLGRVVAKIDLVHSDDRTWHLHGDNVRRGEYTASIRHVYCCKDLGVCRRPR